VHLDGDDVGTDDEEGGVEGVFVEIAFVVVAGVVSGGSAVGGVGGEIGVAESLDAIEIDSAAAVGADAEFQ